MQKLKKNCPRAAAILLSLMMMVVFVPTFAFAGGGASTEPTQIQISKCIKIGHVDGMLDADIYYYNIGDANTTVQLADLAMEEYGMISGLFNEGDTVSQSNIVDLNKGFGVSWNRLKESDKYKDAFDNAACADLDFSNIYGVVAMDDDDENTIFIIQGISLSFECSVGQLVGTEEDAVEYTDWTDWQNPVKKKMDLYTVAVPKDTKSVEVSFAGDRLVYAYDKNDTYLASCGAEGDGSYPESTVGQKKAVVKALDNGDMPPYVYVETPYTQVDENTWVNDYLYAISFVTYTFTLSSNGKSLTNITYEPQAYKYSGYDGEQIAGLYKVLIPADTETVDFKMSGPVIHYNYTREGGYLGGYFADYNTGESEFTTQVDFGDETTAKDGEPDVIQMQIPYDASWKSTLLYGVTFQYDISAAKVTVKNATYTGKALKPAVTVTLNGVTLKNGTDYSAAYSNNKNAGKGKVTLKGLNKYGGSASGTFTIAKAKNPLKVTAKGKTFKVKKVKSKKQTYKAITATKNQGKVSYKVTYKNSKSKKALSFSKGKVTVKKGTKKGTYKMTVKVTAKGTKNYKAITIPKTITIKVK